MDKKQENKLIFNTPNDINVKVSKFGGEVVVNEECCTSIHILLKNTGDMATSFLGAHSPELIKVIEKSFKKYFKTLKKQLRTAENMDNVEVKPEEKIPEDKKLDTNNNRKDKKINNKNTINKTSKK